ncbi:HAD family hydrolase [Candidatus Hodarchaeum mangrovi]
MANPFNLSVDTLIFDFDGTLFNGKTLSLPIFQNCLIKLKEKFGIPTQIPTETEILDQFGKQTPELYYPLLKTKNKNIIEFFGQCVEKTEVERFKTHGELFSGVLETLKLLKKRGYKLALCTNARADYFTAAMSRFQFSQIFDLMLAAGNFPGKDKVWMVNKIKIDLKSNSFAVIGDRIHDFEAAKQNGGIAIGCAYGFGKEEVRYSDHIINDFTELAQIFP